MTNEENLEKVRNNPVDIVDIPIEEQTPEVCLEAVKGWGYTITYIKNQTPELCWIAIRNCPVAIEVIRKPTKEMWDEALRLEPELKFLLDDPNDEPIKWTGIQSKLEF